VHLFLITVDASAVVFIHRRGAKSAESDDFLFAVDPPKNLADRKDGKQKDSSPSGKTHI